MATNITLLPHQNEVLMSKARYVAMVCGYAAGKTYMLGIKAAQLLTLNRCDGLCLAPIYSQLVDFVLPSVLDALTHFGVKYKYNKNSRLITTPYGKIFLRSCSDPDSIAGGTVGWAVLDEFDLVDDQDGIWRIVSSRMRAGGSGGCKLPQIFVCTTPDKGESSLLYEKFVEGYLDDLDNMGWSNYHLIQARTLDNVYIDTEFIISDIIEPYKNDSVMLDRYVNGRFVTSIKGKCFYNLTEDLFSEDIYFNPSADFIHVGMDFNVEYASAVVGELWGPKRNLELHIIDEISKQQDLLAVCRELKKRYPRHCEEGRVIIYPDASGVNRSYIDANMTAFNVLREQGFRKIMTPNKNIGEFSRILRTNIALAKKRVLFAKGPKLKDLKKDLEFVKFDKSGRRMCKKNKEFTHLADAFSYLVIRALKTFTGLYQPNHGKSFITAGFVQ